MHQHRLKVSLAATQTILPLTATADSVTPTPTPTATWTPTPIPPTRSTKLKAGDTAYVITRSAFTAATLLDLPGKTSTGGQACAPSTAVAVLAVSQNAEDVSNPVIYYEVKCTGKQGWLAEYNLTPFKRGDHVTVQPATGAAAPMYAKPDVSTKLDATCAAGTATSVLELTQSAKPELDPHVYVRLTCEGTTGYISDADLVKADS
ncbi:MAG: hypothetical protein KF716_16565 [Anaerolineae bacterium]|nr:hypothetical protein [Anaerolineae bacterium]